ncbi:MAG TPA: sigma-70 family RNA polymerase sigma factor [Ktedonobacteraceae bacterium]|jgi:RNA polymerase sigma factor (sigma-70 family)|nr:sigma-70 family RNA polymerase sigma factor [Ktedonobacteraceae bacterium]
MMHIFKKSDNKRNQQRDQEAVRSPHEISDETLIASIAQGSIRAMEMLYQRYSRPLYSLAYHMVADQQIAEDLLQEAFLAVWRQAHSYSPQYGQVHSWLFSIIHHRAIDYLRASRRHPINKSVPLDEVDRDESTFSPDAWDTVWLSLRRAQVRAALLALRKEQRLVIELAFFQGWTHTEIAEACQIPLGTVKARMRLGLIHLKRMLEHQGMDPQE